MTAQEYYKKVSDLRQMVDELESFTRLEANKHILESITEDAEARRHARVVRANDTLNMIGNMAAFFLDI